MASAILVQHSNQLSYEATTGRAGHFSGPIIATLRYKIIETEVVFSMNKKKDLIRYRRNLSNCEREACKNQNNLSEQILLECMGRARWYK